MRLLRSCRCGCSGSGLRGRERVTTIVASIAFSEFFLLTLYLQDVLHYSAVETGLAFSAIALTIAVVSNLAQSLVTRFGPRGVLTVGLVLVTVSLALIARLPVPGDYTVDLLGPFVLNGIGFALCFIPMTIAGLSGVMPADAGSASGLLNTSRQVGGAVGLAVVNTIAAGYTRTRRCRVGRARAGARIPRRAHRPRDAGARRGGALLDPPRAGSAAREAAEPRVEEPVREAA